MYLNSSGESNQKMVDDIQLLRDFQNGDIHSFELLVKKYKNTVFNTIYSIVGNTDIAEDVSQEVFFKIYNSIAKFKEKSSFSTWLYRITVNTSLNELRKRKKEIISLDTFIDDDERTKLEDVLKSEEDISENLDKKELQETLQKIINLLPEKYRTVLILKEINNLSYEEISKILSISINKVKIWLFRARQKLKEKIYIIE